MPEPLFAGTFSAPPVRVHDYAGGRYAFLDAHGANCWTDPVHRVLLYRLSDVDRVLQAHGYRRDPATMQVVPLNEQPSS